MLKRGVDAALLPLAMGVDVCRATALSRSWRSQLRVWRILIGYMMMKMAAEIPMLRYTARQNADGNVA